MIKKTTLVLLFIFLIPLYSFSFTRFLLSNGMEVLITTNTASPLMSVDLAIKDGYKYSTRNTAGIIDIHSRLFWENQESTKLSLTEIGITNLHTQLTSDASVYSCTVPAVRSEQALSLISELARTSLFDDASLDSVLQTYREEQEEYTSSIYGLIHCLVMEHVYTQSPWNQSKEMGYFYYQTKTRETLRASLNTHRQEFHTPSNTLLLISSPYNDQETLELVKSSFEDWKNNHEPVQIPIQQNENHVTQNFVFVSDGLPKNIEQFISVYTLKKPEKEKADNGGIITAFILNNNQNGFKSSLVQTNELGLEGEDYTHISFEKNHEYSRLIHQSIVQKTKTNPTQKIAQIASEIKKHTSFTDEYIQNTAVYLKSCTDTLPTYNSKETIIKAWAENNEVNLERFEQIPEPIFIESLFSQKPHIFLLLETAQYKEIQNELHKNGWIVISENELRATIKKRLQTKDEPLEVKKTISFSNLSDIFKINSANMTEIHLENGIITSIMNSAPEHESGIVIHIDGGTLYLRDMNPLVEPLLLSYLQKQIEGELYNALLQGLIHHKAVVQIKNGLTSSSIQIQCTHTDIEAVLKATGKALAFAEISPAEADELVTELLSKEKTSLFETQYQLYSTAIETIYGGSGYENTITKTNLDKQLLFSDIQKALSLLFNASRFSVFICTKNQNEETLEPVLTQTFGYLIDTGALPHINLDPIFANTTRWKTLYRLFTTNIQAQDAGQRPVQLIPTTEFSDPSHVYFKRPLNEQTPFFDAALLSLATYLEESENLTKGKTNFSNIDVFFDSSIPQLCGLRFNDVLSYEQIQKSFREALLNYETWLLNETTIEKAKILWINTMMNHTQEAVNIAQRMAIGKTVFNNEKAYLEQYIVLEKSTVQDFREVFSQYFLTQTTLWILSSDTKE